MSLKFITAEEAATYVKHDDNVGFSGFTPAGCPKVIPEAIARRAEQEHKEGRPFKIGMFTGASTGDHLDGALARAEAVKFRTPYQSNKDMRALLNAHGAEYFDMHLSELAQSLRYGFLGRVDVAIVEAVDVTDDGEIVPAEGVGILPTICRLADKILIELNRFHPKELRGIHDIYEPEDPPMRREIPVYKPSDRISQPFVKVDPKKIVGVVETNREPDGSKFAPLDDVTLAIGRNVSDFLVGEMKAGRLPKSFLPLQSGVGNVANAVLGCMGENEAIPPFTVYTEVIQDGMVDLIDAGKMTVASATSFSLSPEYAERMNNEASRYSKQIILRPQQISNHPEVIRRLGLICSNGLIEADIYGNVNSTNVIGSRMMNGVGGSGDFTRAGCISSFITPSFAKGGDISAIVPFVSHVDHTEQDVKVVITEYGYADLRGLAPRQRVPKMIALAHPDYRPLLEEYYERALKLATDRKMLQTPHDLATAFSFHQRFAETGSMKKQ